MSSFAQYILLVLGVVPQLVSPFPVTTAAEVRNLTPSSAGKPRPVYLRGTITYVGSNGKEFYVQDRTGAVFASAARLPEGLAVGDDVELVGVTRTGERGPGVVKAEVTRLGPTAQMLKPDPFDLSAARAAWLDARLVCALGTVRSISHKDGFTLLKLQAGGAEALALFPDPPPGESLDRLLGVRVRVVGVCAAVAGPRERRGLPRILLPSFQDVTALLPPEATIPTVPIAEIAERAVAVGTPRREVRIVGVVTGGWNRRVLFVQDPSGGVAAVLAAETAFAPGTHVEVTGTPTVEGRIGRLLYAKAAPLGIDGPRPEPLPVRSDQLDEACFRDRLVRVEGRVTDVTAQNGGFRVGLADGGHQLDAVLEADTLPSGIEPGAWVAVVGVRTGHPVAGNAAGGHEVVLRSAADATLLRAAPSWWAARGAQLTAGGVGVMGLLGVAWLVTLRARVGQIGRVVKKEQVERDRLEGHLHQAAKLEAVGRLAGGIAHDFNNLLTVINGCAELLADAPAGPKAGELVNDIRQAGGRAAALTSQLLTFSRKRVVSHQPVDLNDIVTDAARLLTRVIGENITIRLALAATVPTIRADAGMLTQILMNLALNARDAMPRGGILTIATGLTPGARDPHAIRLAVRDTGIGMSPEVQARIFDAFYTTKEPSQGTGLGLSIVAGIVRALGGKIGCTSTQGMGTTFDVDFPLAAPGDAPEGEPPVDSGTMPALDPDPTPPLPLPAVRTGVVLLIEDDPAVRLLGQRVLELYGLTVLPAEDADAAIELGTNYLGQIDVVLTDVMMPGGTGADVAARLLVLRPDVRVIFMSGYGFEEMENCGVAAGERDFLQKPFTPAALVEKVNSALGR